MASVLPRLELELADMLVGASEAPLEGLWVLV